MGIFDPIFIGIFAARVSNRLIDLGVDVLKLEKVEPELKDLLYEIEVEKRKEMTPCEAASHFFCAAFSGIPPSCYLLPISQQEMARRAWQVMLQWADEGKMDSHCFNVLQKSLREQQEL